MKYLYIIIFSLLAFSCSNEDNANFTIEDNSASNAIPLNMVNFSFSNYTWLEGKYRDTVSEKKRETHEVWEKFDDSIVGIGFYVKNNIDSTTPDRSVLKWDYNGYYLINTAGGNTAKFKLTAYSQDSLFFKNPAHRYPQEIIYRKTSNHSYEIEMYGYVNQNNRILKFKMNSYE